MMSEISDQVLEKAASDLGRLLRDQSKVLTTAESCTGGWIAKALTDTAGSSDYFQAGLVTYSNTAKEQLIGVSPTSLQTHGAVSSAVVGEMVSGVLALTGADVAVAVSGVAGPGGGTVDKPVGMVWFAWGASGTAPETICRQFSGDRDTVRRQSVLFALQRVRAYLQDTR